MNLISKIKALNLPTGKYVVFGSAVMEIHGIRKAKDIDLVINEDLYRELKKRGWKRKWSFRRFLWCKALQQDGVEAFTNLYWINYFVKTADLIKNAEMIESIPFMSLQDYLFYKKHLPREKDKQDVKLIKNYMTSKKKGFDDRIVRYDKIHRIKDEYYKALIDAIDPQENDVIFEGCAGYADVSKHILAATSHMSEKPEIYIQDESVVQLNIAKQEVSLPDDHILLGDIRTTGMPDGKFNKVVIKMGVHELPKNEQPKVFREMYRILKDGGKFVIWELSLDEETQEVFQEIVKKKNELAGFDQIVNNRYLQRHDELVSLFEGVGFREIKDEYKIRYTFSAKGRFEELISKDRKQLLEKQGKLTNQDERELASKASDRMEQLLNYMRKRVPVELREKVQYKDSGDDVEVTVNKVIMSGRK